MKFFDVQRRYTVKWLRVVFLILIAIFLLSPSDVSLSQVEEDGLYKVIFKRNAVHYGEWSPDSKKIASAVAGGKVIIWDVEADRAKEIPLATDVSIAGLGEDIYFGLANNIAWSQSGQYLAIAVERDKSHDHSIQVWDVETVTKMLDISGAVGAMTFAKSDSLLLIGQTRLEVSGQKAKIIDFWSVPTRSLLRSVTVNDYAPYSIQRLPNQQEVLYTDPSGAFILDLDSGQSKVLFKTEDEPMHSRLSWDGKRAVYLDYWDCVYEWQAGYSKPVERACTFGGKWSFNTKYEIWAVSSDARGQARTYMLTNVVWLQALNKYAVFEMLPHEGRVEWLQWSPDNAKLATVTEYDVLRVWEEKN